MHRQLKYKTPEELENKIDEYFEWVEEKELPVTITGATMFLGFVSKQSLYDYENRDGFSYPIKRLRLAVENAYELKLHENNVTGSIFALKNMGWKDKTEVDNTHTIILSENDMYKDIKNGNS